MIVFKFRVTSTIYADDLASAIQILKAKLYDVAGDPADFPSMKQMTLIIRDAEEMPPESAPPSQ